MTLKNIFVSGFSFVIKNSSFKARPNFESIKERKVREDYKYYLLIYKVESLPLNN